MKVAEMKYFGTDGIRTKAGVGLLSSENVKRWGKAIASAVCYFNPDNNNSVVIGCDTRESSFEIVENLSDSISNYNIKVLNAGVIPTPGVATLILKHQAQIGIVISASHNPYQDNGIKIFGSDGYKVSKELELKIEEFFDSGEEPRSELKKLEIEKISNDEYLSQLVKRAGGAGCFKGLKIVVDCANGAASEIAPKLFQILGCQFVTANVNPDGKNINHECGAIEPDNIASLVRYENADIGVSLDGDADRAIFLDEYGDIKDGDYFLYIIAKKLKKQKKLIGDTAVGTIMTNLGLELSLKKLSINFERTDVGDKFITRRMLEKGYVVGGEPSGHFLVFADKPEWTTGDGLLSTIELLKAMKYFNQPLSKLSAEMVKVPQTTRSVKVGSKIPIEDLPELQSRIFEIDQALGETGRIIARYSGTEPKMRIMLEGQDINILEKYIDEFVVMVKSLLS